MRTAMIGWMVAPLVVGCVANDADLEPGTLEIGYSDRMVTGTEDTPAFVPYAHGEVAQVYLGA